MRRAFKSVFYIRRNYVDKNGKSSIMIRICLDGKRMSAGTTGISVKPELWDSHAQEVMGHSLEARFDNNKLKGIYAELHSIAEKLEFDGDLSLERVKSVYQDGDDEFNTIGELFNKYIDNVKDLVGVSLSGTSYHKYSLCRQRFMDMLRMKYHRKDMQLKSLNPVVIEDFKNYLMTEVGLCNNTAVKTMKTLRTVILHGIKLGVLHQDPYVGVRLHMEKVDRGFLTDDEIEALMAKKFDIPRLGIIRDIFVFSCFTGLAYIDVKELRPQNIVKLNGVDWIMSSRVKTNTPINVVLSDAAKLIMKKYENAPKKKGHVFPTISNQKTNSYLKEIAAECGINKDLTFHMARHTFATLTLSKGVPIETVSRMLGHTNIKTTQIYARITNKKIEHDMEKFFSDSTIKGFNKDTKKMLGAENGDDEKPKKRNARSTGSSSASTGTSSENTQKPTPLKRRGRKPKGGRA